MEDCSMHFHFRNVEREIRKMHKKEKKHKHEVEVLSSENDKPTSCDEQKKNKRDKLVVIEKKTKDGIKLHLRLQSASGSLSSKSGKHRQSKEHRLKKVIDTDLKKSTQIADKPLVRMDSNDAYVLLERLPKDLPRGSHGTSCGTWDLNVLKMHKERKREAVESNDIAAPSLKQKKYELPENALIKKSDIGRTMMYSRTGSNEIVDKQEVKERKLSCVENEADETTFHQIKRRHLESHTFRKEKESNSQWMSNTVEPPGKEIHVKIKEKKRKKEDKNKKDKRSNKVKHLEREEQRTHLKEKSVPEFVQNDIKIINKYKKDRKKKLISDLDTDPWQDTKITSSPSSVRSRISDLSNTNSIHSNNVGDAYVLLEKLPYKPTSNETLISNATKKKKKEERTEQNDRNGAILEQKKLKKWEDVLIGGIETGSMENQLRNWTNELPGDGNSILKTDMCKPKKKHLSCEETKTGVFLSQMETRHIESQDCLGEEDTDLVSQWKAQSAEILCNEIHKISKKKNVKKEKTNNKVEKNMKEEKRLNEEGKYAKISNHSNEAPPTKQLKLHPDYFKIFHKKRKSFDNLNEECSIFEPNGSSVSEQHGSENTHSIVKGQRQTTKTFIDDLDADPHVDHSNSVTHYKENSRESVLTNNSDSNHCTLASRSQKYLEQPNNKHRNQSCFTRQDHGKPKISPNDAGKEVKMLEVISLEKHKKNKKSKKKKQIDLDCNENDATFPNTSQYSFGNTPAHNLSLKLKKKECSLDNHKQMSLPSKKVSKKSSNQKHGSQNVISSHSSHNVVQDYDGPMKKAVARLSNKSQTTFEVERSDSMIEKSSVSLESVWKSKHFKRSLSLKKNDNISYFSKRNLHEDKRRSCTPIGGSASLLIDNINKTSMKNKCCEQSDTTVEVDVTGLSEVISSASSCSVLHFARDDVDNCEHILSNSGLHGRKGKCSDLNTLVVPPGISAGRATEDKDNIVRRTKDCPTPKSSCEPCSASKHASFDLSPDMFSQDSAWSRLSLDSNGVFTQTPENQIPLENCESPAEDQYRLSEQNREKETLGKSQSQRVGPGFTSLSSHDGSACEVIELSDSDSFRSSQEPLIPGRSCLKGLTQKVIVNPLSNKQDEVRKLTEHSNVSCAPSNSLKGMCQEKNKYKSRPYIDDSSDSCLSDDTRNLKGLPYVKGPKNVPTKQKKGSTYKKKLKCDICLHSYLEKTFPTHKCVATRYTCKHCDRSYKRSWHLNHHVKVNHLNVRQYTCDICNTNFSEPQTLKVHKRLHTNTRPYECRVCHKNYTTSSHLYRHYREVHHIKDEFTCEFCELSYSFLVDLENHTQIVHSKILKNL